MGRICVVSSLHFRFHDVDAVSFTNTFLISFRRASLQAVLQSEILLFGAKQSARRIYKVKPGAGKSDSQVNINAQRSRGPRSGGDVGLITLLLWADSNQGQMDLLKTNCVSDTSKALN